MVALWPHDEVGLFLEADDTAGVVATQPRRVAASSVAQHLAEASHRRCTLREAKELAGRAGRRAEAWRHLLWPLG